MNLKDFLTTLDAKERDEILRFSTEISYSNSYKELQDLYSQLEELKNIIENKQRKREYLTSLVYNTEKIIAKAEEKGSPEDDLLFFISSLRQYCVFLQNLAANISPKEEMERKARILNRIRVIEASSVFNIALSKYLRK